MTTKPIRAWLLIGTVMLAAALTGAYTYGMFLDDESLTATFETTGTSDIAKGTVTPEPATSPTDEASNGGVANETPSATPTVPGAPPPVGA
jgi:hypothetical protein